MKQINIGICRFEFNDIPNIDINLPIPDQVDMLIRHVYIADSNDYMANMFGCKHWEEFFGKRLSDLILVSEEKKRDIFKNFILDNYTIHELELSEKDCLGAVRNVELNIIGIIEENKLVSGWSIVRDITEKRKAEKALRDSEERYKAVVEGIPNIVFTSNSEGRSNYFNQRWYAYTGSDYESSKDWNWKNYIHPGDLDQMLRKWDDAIQTGIDFDAEYRLKGNDGTYR